MTRGLLAASLAASALFVPLGVARAQAPPAKPSVVAKPYVVEWVYRVKYGYQAEWWNIFQKYQIAILDAEKQRGFVSGYTVTRPGLHTSEDSRWDYRIIITYPDQAGATHESEVDHQLFPDRVAEAKDEQTRWELTLNHWDLPIHDIDPHEVAD